MIGWENFWRLQREQHRTYNNGEYGRALRINNILYRIDFRRLQDVRKQMKQPTADAVLEGREKFFCDCLEGTMKIGLYMINNQSKQNIQGGNK